MIKYAYEYLYYKLYVWYMKKWGEDNGPQITAMLVVSITIWVNVMSVPTIVESVTGFRLVEFKKLPKLEYAVLFLGWLLFNYFALVHKGRHSAIVKRFQKESNGHSHKGNMVVLLYVIGSLILLFGSWVGVYLRNT